MSTPFDRIVIDANVAVAAVLPAAGFDPLPHLKAWHGSGTDLLAPGLLIPEAVSAIRRYVSVGQLGIHEAERATHDLFELGVTFHAPDRAVAQRSLALADLLGQSRAYDATYLALAEQRDAVFVSVDQRLVRRARQVGLGERVVELA